MCQAVRVVRAVPPGEEARAMLIDRSYSYEIGNGSAFECLGHDAGVDDLSPMCATLTSSPGLPPIPAPHLLGYGAQPLLGYLQYCLVTRFYI